MMTKIKNEYLIRTNSDEDIKIVRAEFKRLGFKFNENCDRTLTKNMLSDEELNQFDLTKVFIFKNIIVNNISKNLAMLISQNPIKWDR